MREAERSLGALREQGASDLPVQRGGRGQRGAQESWGEGVGEGTSS